jgi:hypothetical protein
MFLMLNLALNRYFWQTCVLCLILLIFNKKECGQSEQDLETCKAI